MNEIKLIIFDMGGVLVIPKQKFKEIHQKIGERHNATSEQVQEAFYEFFEDYHFKRTLSMYNFWKKVLNRLDKDINDEDIQFAISLYENEFLTDTSEEKLELLKDLSQKYKIALLSHASREMDKSIFSSNYIKYIDRICLSQHNSKKKNFKEAFTDILDAFDCKPEEAIFTDDQEKNLVTARELGLHVHLFEDLEGFKGKLKELDVKI